MQSRPDHDVLADPTRRLILGLLTGEPPLRVCERAAPDDVKSGASRHLAILGGAGWLERGREGTGVRYRLAPLVDSDALVVRALTEGRVLLRDPVRGKVAA